MSEQKYRIGITQGDPNGIGWEIILKSFADARMTELCTPIIYGSPKAADLYKDTIEEFEKIQFNTISSASESKRGRVNLIVCGDEEKPEPGIPTQAAGKAAVVALQKAAADLRDGKLDALVTAPFNKETVQADDFRYTGHTEFFAAELGGQPLMIMCSEVLKVGLVTIHIPVSQVADQITKEKIITKLGQLRTSLKQDFGVVEPRIAVLSLNPHAGDGGLLGKEEIEIIKPAIVEAFSNGVLAFGPFAADGLFASGGYKKYDAILAMYHDQGLAPFKTLSPDGVNFTAGLSKVRTSPDHGVAYDIAGKDKADPQSMRSAVYTAIDIVERRGQWAEWTRDPLQQYERDRGSRDISVRDLPDTEKEN